MAVNTETSVARAGSADRPGPAGNVATPLLAALFLLLAMALVWVLAELVPYVRAHDALLLARATSLQSGSAAPLSRHLLATLETPYAILWSAAIVAIALTRGRPRLALAAAAILLLAPVSAEVLKPLLAHAHDRAGATQVGAVSWPSGHAAASMALVCALALVVPRGARPLVIVLGALYVLAIGCALLILAWHMPSDVLGGWLLAGFWTALAVAGLRFWARRSPERRRW